jgi:hypothetical protein
VFRRAFSAGRVGARLGLTGQPRSPNLRMGRLKGRLQLVLARNDEQTSIEARPRFEPRKLLG